MSDKGHLFVVGTPIGNLEDITLRAISTLKDVNIILAEDTRNSKKLLSAHGIQTRMMSYHEHSSEKESDFLVTKPNSSKLCSMRVRLGGGIILFFDNSKVSMFF